VLGLAVAVARRTELDLVSLDDEPAQLGAGLMTAVIGTPYFLYLLVRTRH
jgi:ABC-type Fe3+-siderophore transport system permease subunit